MTRLRVLALCIHAFGCGTAEAQTERWMRAGDTHTWTGKPVRVSMTSNGTASFRMRCIGTDCYDIRVTVPPGAETTIRWRFSAMPEPDRRAWPLVAGEPNVTDAYLVVTETEFEQAAASTRLAVSLHDLQGRIAEFHFDLTGIAAEAAWLRGGQ